MVDVAQLQPATFAEFLAEAKRGNVIAVARPIATGATDSLNPVDAFVSVAGGSRFAFLFESVEGGEGVAKYSFLGADPYMIVRGRDEETTIERDGRVETRAERVTEFLRRHFRANKLANRADLGPLAGGAVGYLGYQAANWFEPALKRNAAQSENLKSEIADLKSQISNFKSETTDDALLMFFRTLVVFDRAQHLVKVVSVVFTDEADQSETRLQELYNTAVRETERIKALLLAPAQTQPSANDKPARAEETGPANDRSEEAAEVTKTSVHSNWARADFEFAVGAVKEHIFAGDCYQAVISQRFARNVTAGPVAIYRALRRSNPAPYTYLLKLADEAIIGASPEMLVRCRGRRLDYRPIAGTRPRGATEAEDRMLAEEMRADEKEVAEHMMLVDLGRNDLGRVAEFGSVKVEDLMSVERYSKVQHLVSSLSGRLRVGADRFDALAACFPAGTVTGAPKVRAMEIVRELEPDERGVYAGAVLYIDYAENLDSCIAIRTIVLRDGEASVQAGAGIVADSVPEREYEETVHKAHALLRAIELAEEED
jgi:anthranilate synthase component 1